MQFQLFNEIDIEGTPGEFQAAHKEKTKEVAQFRSFILGDAELRRTTPLADLVKQRALFNESGEIAKTEENDGDEGDSKGQLLKWVGNKRRFADEIVSYFPEDYGTYFEPFLGSGAVWAALAPKTAHASDIFTPLIEIWRTLQDDPEKLKHWYIDRWNLMMGGNKVEVYENIKASYNARPNAADLLFLSRSCYGGVVRFRKRDGYMSTPCGPHKPMLPETFIRIVDKWNQIATGTTFARMDYTGAMNMAREGDLIYCDPPYTCSQSILYGAQSFNLRGLFAEIRKCKACGVRVALSIDGTKKSGNTVCKVPIPEGLFEREILVNCGGSMLKRFQMDGRTMEEEVIADRLLLTYS
ncbi:MAG: DNA adenine methylase [Ktedonobacteraceae bacterium]